MTIAELHGKVSHIGTNLSEKMEDLLTSDVFSVCKYVHPETLLMPFLRKAKTVDGNLLENVISEKVTSAEYKFWPKLNGCEPDVLVLLRTEKDRTCIVLIEAKYLSGLESITADEEYRVADIPEHQLIREFHDLYSAHKQFKVSQEEIDNRFVILITAHRLIPEGIIREIQNKIRQQIRREYSPEIYWANWFLLHHCLRGLKADSSQENLILEDLYRLLERKNLTRFLGIGKVRSVKQIRSIEIFRPRKLELIGVSLLELNPVNKIVKQDMYFMGSKSNRYDWRLSKYLLAEQIYVGAKK